ncbi:Hypothetical protein NTJ_13773 [Nesidiocoris tenuis]|uniref:Uncharacterized protein n=1 Tax=Nesidiocoris tenuis TaxID=355587 RepID=A0ABN7B994_9HEMI|nr:Hypothetical protein NTJ_13773 [Nesidiocoris tenuis]
MAQHLPSRIPFLWLLFDFFQMTTARNVFNGRLFTDEGIRRVDAHGVATRPEKLGMFSLPGVRHVSLPLFDVSPAKTNGFQTLEEPDA